MLNALKKANPMKYFTQLIDKANEKGFPLLIQFDPNQDEEQWAIKLYPEPDSDAHYYAYNNCLEDAARQLLDELRGFRPW